MPFMLVRHEVEDFPKWKAIFDSHAEAQKQVGLHIKHVLRNMENPNEVFLFFEVEDIEKAKAFMSTPEAAQAGEDVGVADAYEMYFLT